MLCAISNAVPEVPVVSVKSGHVFEKSLVEKFISDHGTCPVTGDSLTLDDLIPLKTAKASKPRTNAATSIPGLLGMLHNEYDAVMLETHQLREQLHRARQELAHALYQQDAASRVIARMQRERQDAVSKLENLKSQITSGQLAAAAKPKDARMSENGDHDMPDAKRAKAGITMAIVDEMVAKSQQLMEMRKNRDPNPAGLAAREDFKAFAAKTHPLHSSTKGGITALALSPAVGHAEPRCIATGGVDQTVTIFDITEGRVIAQLPGHTKKVTALAYSTPELLLSGSADRTVKLWQPSEDAWALKCSLRDFDDSVVRICVHPVSKYSITIAANAAWHFHDLSTQQLVTSVSDGDAGGQYLCGQVHPDGALVGIGTSAGAVRIWDIKESKFMVAFTEGIEGHVHDVAFNENGYWLATACDKSVQVWDLRKLRMAVEVHPFEAGPTKCLAWDHAGKYLACGGSEVKIYGVAAIKGKKGGGKGAEAELLKSLVDIPSKGATCMAFGALANTLYVGASDHNLRIFGQ